MADGTARMKRKHYKSILRTNTPSSQKMFSDDYTLQEFNCLQEYENVTMSQELHISATSYKCKAHNFGKHLLASFKGRLLIAQFPYLIIG